MANVQRNSGDGDRANLIADLKELREELKNAGVDTSFINLRAKTNYLYGQVDEATEKLDALKKASEETSKTSTVYVSKGEIRSNNDCVRKAIEYSTGISHQECKKITINNGWTSKGMTLVNAISSLWEAAQSKPTLKSNVSLNEIANKTGIVFVDDSKHAIGVKNGIPEQEIKTSIVVAAWI